MSDFKTYQPALGPTWLQGPNGKAWLKAFGSIKDALVARAKEAVKARFALIAPTDALAFIGLERGIERSANESDASYAARLKAAWDTWPWAGTPYGLLRALLAAGYVIATPGGGSNVYLEVVLGKEYSLDANGALSVAALPAGSWQFAQPQSFWSKFLVLVAHTYPSSWLAGGLGAVFTGGNVDTGVVGASGTPTADYRFIVRITGSGGVGAARFDWSSDNGSTYASIQNTAAGPISLGSTGVSITFTGTFTNGDLYRFTTQPPNNTSDDANRFRRLITTWKPGHATCAGITVYMLGELWGYPHGTWGDAGNWGGGQKVDWTYP